MKLQVPDFKTIREKFKYWKLKMIGKYSGFASSDEIDQILDIGMWHGYREAIEKGEERYMTSKVTSIGRWYLQDTLYDKRKNKDVHVPPEILDNIPEKRHVPFEDRVVFWLMIDCIRKRLRKDKYRRVLESLIEGFTQSEIAKKESVSPAEVSLVINERIKPVFESFGYCNASAL